MIFRISGLNFRYSGTPVFQSLTLEIPEGVTGIVGPSGAGKTTLLHLLGLLRHGVVPGAITCGNADYGRLGESERDRLRGRSFGFVLQSCYLLPYLSCRENVALPLELQGVPWNIALESAGQIVRNAGDPGLAECLDSRPSEISQGQRQRFAVLRSIVHHPAVVFADEPTSNLDDENTERMISMLRAWQQGAPTERSLILVSHDRNLIRAAADRTIVIRKGSQPDVENHPQPPSATGPVVPLPPMPSIPGTPRLGFLLHVAYRDLFDRRFRLAGWLVFVALVLVAFLAATALAWPRAAELRRIAQLEERPLSNLVFVDPPYAALGGRISESDFESLRQALQAKLGPRLVSVVPTSARSYSFQVWNPNPAAPAAMNTTNPIRGRTVTGPDDPLLKSQTWRAGRGLASTEDRGIVVCPRFLEALGFPSDLPLPINLGTMEDRQPFAIVGISATNFPQGYGFLIAERALAERVAGAEFARRIQSPVDTRLIGATWVAFLEQPANRALLEKECARKGIEVDVILDGLLSRIRLTKPETSVADWNDYLRGLGNIARQRSPGLEELNLDLSELPSPPTGQGNYWHGITVQVDDVAAIPDAVTVVKERGLSTNETISAQLTAFAEAGEEARKVNARIVGLVIVIVGMLVFVAQSQQLARKQVEIGLLRALGLSRRGLLGIYSWQAAGLSIAAGFIGGAASAGLLFGLVGPKVFPKLIDGAWLFQTASVFGGIIAVMLAANGIAGRQLAGGSPADRLSGS